MASSDAPHSLSGAGRASRSPDSCPSRPGAQGTECLIRCCSVVALATGNQEEGAMDGIIYLVGLIVVVMAILSFLGLR